MSDPCDSDNNATAAQQRVPPSVPAQDECLTSLVQIANLFGVFTGVTLTLGGIVITGEIVSGVAYFKGLSEALNASGATVEHTPALHKVFEAYGRLYEPKQATGSDELPDEPVTTPVYIHLKDARILLPNGQFIPSGGCTWWRGRLAAVDGYILGCLSPGS